MWLIALGLGMGLARGSEVDSLARELAWSPSDAVRVDATKQLQDLDDPTIGAALAGAFSWAPERRALFVGGTPLVAALALDDDNRRDVATELMAWRISLTLVRNNQVPPRLEAELRGVLGEEIEAYGQPTQTTDWIHLLGATGADLHALLDRLDLHSDARWNYVVEIEDLLRVGDLSDALPLLGHRSPIVRNRAAERFESTPDATRIALRKAWRPAPGRMAPLRGDIAVPVVPWEEAQGERWARKLVRWARRTYRQRDDRALRATLRLLCADGLSPVLTEGARHNFADALIRTAKKDIKSQRAADLAQGMDALLRQVPFDEGARPAPDEQSLEGEVWIRQWDPL